jgi:hypothetical protein
MKSKIVSIPIGMLSSLTNVVELTKNTWKAIKRKDAKRISFLTTLFRILSQKIYVKNEYSKKV